MANLKQKYILCVVLLGFATSVASLELDDETKGKITELVGAKQITLRRYLEGIKQETDKIEYNVRRITAETKDSFWKEVNNTINDIKNHAVKKTENTECSNQMDNGILEIMNDFESIHLNCISSTKPDIADVFRDISKFAELQSKIGSTPKKCLDTNNDVEPILKCIKASLDDIEKEMKDGNGQIINKIQQIQKQINGLENSVNSCQNKELGAMKNKANEIKEQFDECTK